jgi:molybdate transport system regulatory protein
MASLSIRVDLTPSCAIGPGKIQLLEVIDATGSISAAGRAMAMSYRRAWLLLDELNHIFAEPVATTTLGGRTGGGATLTPFGKRLVEGYRRMERDTDTALSEFLAIISHALAPKPTPAAAPQNARAAGGKARPARAMRRPPRSAGSGPRQRGTR